MTQVDWLNDVIVSIAVFTGFVIAGKALVFLIDRVLRKFTKKTGTKLGDMLLDAAGRPAFYLLVLWGFYVALHRLSINLGSTVLSSADKVVFVIALGLVVKVVYDLLGVLVDWYGVRAAEAGQEGVGRSILPLVKKLIKVFVILSGLIVALDHFGYNITSLVAALGVSSLAVGLAAKETLSNMISGFAIFADKPFRVGDRIETDGKSGDVVEIGLRSTRIKTLEGTMMIIPNSKLVDNVVVNYAYPDRSLICSFRVAVEYGSDSAKVKEILTGAARGIQQISADPAPEALFVEHGDWSMVFQLNYNVPDFGLKDDVRDKLNTLVNRRFKEAGISFACPTRKVYQQSLAGLG